MHTYVLQPLAPPLPLLSCLPSPVCPSHTNILTGPLALAPSPDPATTSQLVGVRVVGRVRVGVELRVRVSP